MQFVNKPEHFCCALSLLWSGGASVHTPCSAGALRFLPVVLGSYFSKTSEDREEITHSWVRNRI